ncbi:hypothetical protein [Thermoleophilum album]|uniref:PDZ domain-containing protein n=1 Tax=Thermoleophilum album TaxID=29539 RepID=A0A1H6FR31_THEAL|nr:hypothetical protein [Thermoleophilum album]SEH12802.1 hypothetical protein SAMN02745716_1208 [Thermoleophilum album]
MVSRSRAVCLAVCVSVVAGAGFAAQAGADTEPSDVTPAGAVAELRAAAPEVLGQAPRVVVGGETLDPALRREGSGFTLEGAGVDARVSASAGGGFALEGAGDAPDLVVRPQGVSPDADAGVRAGDAVVFANTQPGADQVVKANALGLETFVQIRGPESPEDYSYTVDLRGEGQRLVLLDSGAVAIVDPDGNPVAVATPPQAHDANGKPVPVTASVNGNTLTLHVPHTTGNYAYPIVVDPFWHWFRRAAKCAAGGFLGAVSGSRLGWWGAAIGAAAGCYVAAG